MTGDVFFHLRLASIVLHDAGEHGAVETPPFIRQEEIRSVRLRQKLRTTSFQVKLDRFHGNVRQRELPVLPSFAEKNPQSLLFDIDVEGRELGELGDADAGGVEGFENGPVSKPPGCCLSSGLDDAPDLPR